MVGEEFVIFCRTVVMFFIFLKFIFEMKKAVLMKKIFLFLLIVLIALPAFTQELKKMTIIGKPQKLQSGEMVARRDQNGNYCAAIQVVSDMDGFGYDSNDGRVGEILDNPGEDIVYLTAGERVLKVFRNGYEPLQIILSDHGIILKEREIWQIKIAGNEAADVLPVTFRFTPEDATLFIDGKEASVKLTQELGVGEHQVKLVRDGYQNIEKTITVNKNKVFFEWTMEDAPDAGLQITTTPAGATVYLDGVRLGESPVAAFYPPGIYPIKITREGFVPIENESLEVVLPQTRKSYTLEENVGYLTVKTREGATVYFNGEVITNPKKVKLSPQLVKVKVSMPKAADLEEQVVIKKDDDKTLEMSPDIQTGTIQIAVTPFDAAIELTGDAGEHFSSEGMKVFDGIPVGTYTMKISAEDYKTNEETVILKPNEKVNKSITLEKGSDFEMIFVKGGTFTMGCTSEQSDCNDDEKPAHKVTVSDFYIGKYEVSQKLWKEIMDDNPSDFSDCDSCPIENISWHDAQKFIRKLNQISGKTYRLPTESEWEYAARGASAGSATVYAGSNNIDEVAWYSNNSGSKTRPVGGKKANELGLYDMSGNVWEWCSDWYGSDYYKNSPQNNPKGPSSGEYRVLRGGSWNNSRNCCVVSRIFFNPDYGFYFFGFRLAQDF